jgi:NAD(P)-dependent dehydrogenase (short-subunit alcohol dehydrogenase family)
VEVTFDFSGRVAVVTGAAGNVGFAVARALAGAGARVLLTDLDGARLETRLAALRAETRAECVAEAGDVGTSEGVQGIFARLDDAFGRVDMLMNVAGINPLREAPERFPLDVWDTLLRTNLTGYFLCAQAAGGRMIAAGHGGSIVSVSSIAGSTSLGRGNLAYGTSKGAVNQLTRELAIAWASHGIRVNAVQPAQIADAAWQTWFADPTRRASAERIMSGIPLGRMVEADEVAAAMLFLASDAAAMITGVLLPVDGGNLALNAGATATP